MKINKIITDPTLPEVNSYWAKKFSEVHLPEPHFCGIPRLGNNYADVAIKENRKICKDCLELKTNYTQVCVWPGCSIGEDTPAEFEKGMAEHFNGVRIKYCETIKTNPDLKDGRPVPETGGRSDLFFLVHTEDVGRFAIPRLQVGIRWWEDVLSNGGAYLYPDYILQRYPKTW